MKNKPSQIKILFLLSLSIWVFVNCIKPKKPQFHPLALTGAINTTPYSFSDFGLTDENQTPTVNPNTTPPKLPLISEYERLAVKDALIALQQMELTSQESLAASSKFSMDMFSEIPETNSELDELNDKILLGKPIPARKRESREEVIRRETAAGERYFSELRANFPQTSVDELKLLRANLTISLILNKLMRDFNDPINGIPIELLENVKNQTVKLRQEVTTELVNRGVTSL